ncbi:hypothetical protein OS493_013832 [Desmophyllum pertusum]|uniref:CUB domain-containing protein n=1 Tax=Desmophyllum pertusum TaxID=174260 RepID=A0A9X0D4V7_9CNID|nr:hypothetical protein OS493_013832 [Desmophyllum pertusum]
MGVWPCSALLIIALSVWSPKVVYSAPCVFDMIFSSGRGVISYDSSLNASSCKNTEGCSCVITAPPGHHILLKFYTFQLSDFTSDVWQVNDWLNVYDGNTTNDGLLGKFTGAMRPFTVQSSSRSIMVMLNRDEVYARCTFEGVYTYSTTKGSTIADNLSLELGKRIGKASVRYSRQSGKRVLSNKKLTGPPGKEAPQEDQTSGRQTNYSLCLLAVPKRLPFTCGTVQHSRCCSSVS